MKKITKTILDAMSTRLGFVFTLLLLYWFKTMWAYTVDFNLDIQGFYQVFLAVISLFILREPKSFICYLLASMSFYLSG